MISTIKFQVQRLDNGHWDTIAFCPDTPSELANMLHALERIGYDVMSMRVIRQHGKRLASVAV